MTRILSVFNLLKRVGFAVLFSSLGFRTFAQPPVIEWTRSYTTTGMFTARSIYQTSDGEILVSGVISVDSFDPDLFVMRLDSSGDSLSTMLFANPHPGEDGGGFLVPLPDGGFVIAGFGSVGSPPTQAYAARVSNSGQLLWERTIGATNSYEVNSAMLTSSGNILLAGRSGSVPLAIQLGENGDSIWTRTYSTLPQGEFYDVVEINSDQYIFVGEARISGNTQLVIAWTDSLGILTTSLDFGGEGGEIGNSIASISRDSILVFGQSNSFSESTWDAYCLMITADEDTLCVQTITNDEYLLGQQATTTHDDAFLIASIAELDASWGIEVAKLTPNCSLEWSRVLPMSNEWIPWGAICETPDNTILVAGTNGLNQLIVTSLGQAQPAREATPFIVGTTIDVFPNPFNSSLNIVVDVAYPQSISLSLLDINGRLVRRLSQNSNTAGRKVVQLDTTNLCSGCYFVNVHSHNGALTKKIFCVK
ncbi:MAG: T9SS type A sorting domain-containing protein [bacterium]|nr:T9SS type A sorting domain-containing protein [bacterium]